MHQTIDQIFLNSATKQADTIALTDNPGNARLGLSTIDELNYRQAEQYITQTAKFFRTLGFHDGDIVLLQLPNIAETPLIILSLINAGLVPAMLPIHWRGKEITQALKSISPKAVLAHHSTPDYDLFSTMFEIAAAQLSMRYIFGLGDDLPDGVTPLPNLTDIISSSKPNSETDKVVFRRSGEQVALIGWSNDTEGTPLPVAYTHIQLMANTHLIRSTFELSQTPSILSTYSPSTLHGLTAALMPWIMEAGTLHLTSSLNINQLVTRIKTNDINLVLIPKALGAKLSKALWAAGITDEQMPHLNLVATTPVITANTTKGQQQRVNISTDNTTILYNLNGLCVIPSREETAEKGLLKLGPQPGPSGEKLSPPFLETRLQGATQKAGDNSSHLHGRLELNGSAIGFAHWQENMTITPLSNFDEHWEETHLKASITDQALSAITIEGNDDTIYYGNNQLSGQELDQLYQAYPGFIDAAAFSIEDPLLGERLFAAIIPKPGDTLSYEDFKNHLLAQNISPTKIPEKLVTVDEIPRSQEGTIVRQAILTHP